MPSISLMLVWGHVHESMMDQCMRHDLSAVLSESLEGSLLFMFLSSIVNLATSIGRIGWNCWEVRYIGLAGSSKLLWQF